MSIKPTDKTTAISVTNVSSTEVSIGSALPGDYASKAAFLNTGATVVSCQVGRAGSTPAAVAATAGTPSSASIVLPASMTAPVVFSVPSMPFGITTIGSAAGPSIIFITPCEE